MDAEAEVVVDGVLVEVAEPVDLEVVVGVVVVEMDGVAVVVVVEDVAVSWIWAV